MDGRHVGRGVRVNDGEIDADGFGYGTFNVE